jgi:hypothetical protein
MGYIQFEEMKMRRFAAVAGFAILAMVSGLVLTPQRASAMSFTWSGAVSIQWTDPCNWQPKNACTDTKYPGSNGRLDDIADIEAPLSGFTEVAPPASVTLSGLTVGDGITLDAGDITVTGSFIWTGGNVKSQLDLGPASSSQISGNALKLLSGTLNNAGDAQLSGMGHLRFGYSPPAVLTNSGTFTLIHDATIDDLACCVQPASIVNSGTLAADHSILSSSDTATIYGVSLENQGTIDVRSGVLELDVAPGSMGTNATITGQGRLLVTDSAGLALSGPFEVTPDATLEVSTKGVGGSLSGRGRMDGGGTLDWTGGTLDAALGIPQGSRLRIEGTPSKTLAGTLAISGTAVLSDTGSLLFGFNPAGVITNTGTFTAYLGTHFQDLACCNNPPRFENQGTLVIDRFAGQAAATKTNMEGVALHNVGSVDVVTGTLELRIAPSSMAKDARISGAGRVRVTDSAKLALGGPFDLDPESTLEISADGVGGVLGGAGSLNGGGTLDWTGGTITAALTIPQSSRLRIEGGLSKILAGTLINAGTAVFSDTGHLLYGFGPPGVITNTGTFTAYLGTTFQGMVCCVNPPRFENQGTLAVDRLPGQPVTGTVTMEDAALYNAGTVKVVTGTLQVNTVSFMQTGGLTELDGARLASDQAIKILGGTLGGSGTVAAALRNAGTLSPGLSASGVLTITQDYTQMITGTLALDLGGRNPDQFDRVMVGGQATLDGTLKVGLINHFQPRAGDSFRVMNYRNPGGDFTTRQGLDQGGSVLEEQRFADHLTLAVVQTRLYLPMIKR